ncbi:hypothetical protein A2U01_0036215, partial [Trifolium medium]|nr:hypothetical protein [Trifolium medium]
VSLLSHCNCYGCMNYLWPLELFHSSFFQKARSDGFSSVTWPPLRGLAPFDSVALIPVLTVPALARETSNVQDP